MKKSLPIVCDNNTKILIVGTAPGEQSIKEKEYYTNKSNRFWKIIFDCLGEDDPEIYSKRLDILHKNKIGLWDVYETFDRDGSQDKKIKAYTLNDFSKLQNSVRVIISNGNKPYQKIKKQICDTDKLLLSCYSTSSSHIYANEKQITNDWKKALNLAKYI